MIHNIIFEMTQNNRADTHRVGHALKVYALAACIAGKERVDAETQRIVETAAVLHDIAIRYCEETFGSCSGKLQEQHGPAVARPILQKHTSDTTFIDRVLYLIAHHHTYEQLGIDHQILIEADFLVNRDEGDISPDAFASIYKKHFRTTTGKSLAAAMFDI